MRAIKIFLLLFSIVVFVSCDHTTEYSQHPNVGLTAKAAHEIKLSLGKMPILDASFDALKTNVEAELANGIDVPIPVDPAGGYTHNRHKQNYISMYGAATLWQITGQVKYASFVKEMLLKYANMYPSLTQHPVKKSYAPGKIFWQSLNDAVWMVYTSQAYDCIYDILSDEERKLIEGDLLIPFCDFLSVESTHVFNRIHNHGVWAVAAVGMAGFAMQNEEMVERAFYGLKTEEVTDNETAGFFVQLNELFSPDGYYTEGPYYQRYALLPYLLFSQAIENNKPDLKIFEYRDGILKKAVLTTLQLTNTDGRFFPINDALKSMSYLAPELINGLDIVYHLDPSNKYLLDVAQQQGKVVFSEAGLAVAKAVANNEMLPFKWESREFLDGRDGDQGAVGVLRSSSRSEQSVLLKYASQGLGHGHFDRLGITVYDNGKELIRDYGSARFVNVEYKQGGRYLPENNTWSKQTIAHNTVTVDFKSQFEGNWKASQKVSAKGWFFDASNPDFQIVSAKEENAYDGVKMQRTLAMIKDPQLFENTLLIDVYGIWSDSEHTYDMPFYYNGHLMYSNTERTTFKTLQPLGNNYGYQHLWLEYKGNTKEANTQFVWLKDRRFYTLISENTPNDEILFARIGANDPEFNLRNEPNFIIRKKGKNTVYASVLEIHGDKDPVTEIVNNQVGVIRAVKTLYHQNDYSLVALELEESKTCVLAIANKDNGATTQHKIELAGKVYQWQGPYKFFK